MFLPADVSSPTENERLVAATVDRGWRTVFPNGMLLVVHGGTHGVVADDCIPLEVGQFVSEGTARALDTACVGLFRPPPFALSSP